MTVCSFMLVVPGQRYLDSFTSALAQSWSPDSSRDASAQMLAEIAGGADHFLANLVTSEGIVTLADGSTRPRLPVILRWMWDGEFCGSINLRWRPGTDAPPKHVSGHVGYSVVPWKRRRGYATAALAMILEEARGVGLRQVEITADEDNHASQRVIEKVGGVLAATRPPDPMNAKAKRAYIVDLAK